MARRWSDPLRDTLRTGAPLIATFVMIPRVEIVELAGEQLER